MIGSRMDAETRAEVLRRLVAGVPAARIAKDMRIGVERVRKIRDEQRIPPGRSGSSLPGQPKPVRWDDTDEVDGDPVNAKPHRIDAGQWCVERPNQVQWLALCAAAKPQEADRLKRSMCVALGLSVLATDEQIEDTLIRERRTADELAALYLAAAGWVR